MARNFYFLAIAVTLSTLAQEISATSPAIDQPSSRFPQTETRWSNLEAKERVHFGTVEVGLGLPDRSWKKMWNFWGSSIEAAATSFAANSSSSQRYRRILADPGPEALPDSDPPDDGPGSDPGSNRPPRAVGPPGKNG